MWILDAAHGTTDAWADARASVEGESGKAMVEEGAVGPLFDDDDADDDGDEEDDDDKGSRRGSARGGGGQVSLQAMLAFIMGGGGGGGGRGGGLGGGQAGLLQQMGLLQVRIIFASVYFPALYIKHADYLPLSSYM